MAENTGRPPLENRDLKESVVEVAQTAGIVMGGAGGLAGGAAALKNAFGKPSKPPTPKE